MLKEYIMAKTPSNTISDSNDERSDRTAIRQSFRVPVGFKDDIFVILDNEAFPVVDIGPEGINITTKNQTRFMEGLLIQNCELIIPGTRIKNLTARIVHCSGDPDKNWNHGIHWIDLTDNAQEQIVAIISKIKQKLRQAASK